MKACSMTRPEIRGVILDILENIAPDEDLTDLNDADPFREQMELDSMDFLDIVMELRKRYRVQIPEEDYPHLNTMDGTVNYLEPKLADVRRLKKASGGRQPSVFSHALEHHGGLTPTARHGFARKHLRRPHHRRRPVGPRGGDSAGAL